MVDNTTTCIFVGIDLSLTTNHVVVTDEAGTLLASFAVGNDLPGAEALVERTIDLARRAHASGITIGMEATGLYWFHLHRFLTTHVSLNQEFFCQVYTVNPKLIKRFHRATADLDKTDPIDARVIADCLRFGKLPHTHLIDETYEPLKRLTRFRYHLVKSVRMEKNYFLAYLFLKYSSWQKLSPFHSAFSTTSQEVISEFDTEELVAMSPEAVVAHVIAASGNKVPDPTKAAVLLARIARTSYKLDAKFKEPVDLILTNTYDNIRFLTDKVRALDTVITKEFNRFPNPLPSITGIGPVFSAGITAELGSVSRFPTQSAIGKYAGLTWKKRQSGAFEGEETPGRPGNTYLKYYLVQAANSLRVHDESYRQYYERKVSEVPKHKHKRALVLTARKLVRLCFAMLRDQRLYQPGYQKGGHPKS